MPVSEIVQSKIIYNWESQDEPEHLRTIRDRLCRNEKKLSQLLGIYQQVLQQNRVITDGSAAQAELQLSGLVIKRAGHLHIANKIYQQVFNQDWVTRNLQQLRPYRETMAAWLASDQQDESRLLQGQALQTALEWKADKRLSTEDEAFLTASQTYDKRLVQAQLVIEQQAKQVLAEANQEAQQKIRLANRRMGIGSAVLVGFLGLAAIAGMIASITVANAVRDREELDLVIQSLETDRIVLEQPLDALIKALKTTQQLSQMKPPPAPESEVHQQAIASLQRALSEVREYNRLRVDGRVTDIQFSSDGRLLASGNENGTVRIWSKNGTLLHTLTDHEDYVWSVRFSPDDQRLASVSRDKTIRLWNVKTGKLTQTILAHKHEVRGLSFSPNGKLLASASAGGEIKLWDANTGDEVNTIAAHPKHWVNFLAFSPGGDRLASASQDGSVKLWKVGLTGEQDQLIKTFEHGALVRSISFSRDGQQLVSVGSDSNIERWNVETDDGGEAPPKEDRIGTLRGHRDVVWDADFLLTDNPSDDSPSDQSAESALVSVSNDESIKIWNLARPKNQPQTLLGHRGTVRSVAVSPDGQVIASAGTDQTIRLWRVQGSEPFTLTAHNSQPVWSMQYSPTGELFASAGKDGTVKLWRADTQQLVRVLPDLQTGIHHIAFSPDGQKLAAAGKENTVTVWDVKTGLKLHTFIGHNKAVRVVAFSPDGQWLASGSGDRTVKLWQLEDGKELMTLRGHSDRIHALHFSPDSQLLASASFDQNVILWGIPEGEKVNTLQGHTTRVTAVQFSPDGQQLATGSGDTTIRLWDIPTGNLSNTLKGDGWVRGLDFDSTGTRLASASHGGAVQIWDQNMGDLLETFTQHSERLEDISFSVDGKTLASASQNGTVSMWQLNRQLDALETAGCAWLQEYFESHPKETVHLCGTKSLPK